MAHYWKRLLKAGVYGGQNGVRETYTEKDLLDLAANGKKLHAKGVLCPLPKNHHDGAGHLPMPVLLSDESETLIDAITSTPIAWDPLANQGFVVDWAYIDDPSAAPPDLANASDNRGWLMGKIEIDDANTELLDAIKQGRVRSTSLGSLTGYRLPSEDVAEEFEGRVPLHVALTLHPKVDNEAGFIEAKTPETHTVALLSQEVGDPSKIVRLSLLDDVKPPLNPVVEKQKQTEKAAQQENENPSEQGESEGDPSASLASLIQIVNESGIFELPPDTTPDNVIDRLKVLFHNQKQLTGAVDEDEPVGPPPPGSKTQDNKPSLMDNTNPTVIALLRGYSIGRKNQRIARAKALAKRSPAMKKYIEGTIIPMIESAGEPVALLDDTGAPVLDETTGAPSFTDEPVDTVLATLEAAPSDPGGFDITNPDSQSEAHNTPTDFDPQYGDEEATDEDKQIVSNLLQYTGH